MPEVKAFVPPSNTITAQTNTKMGQFTEAQAPVIPEVPSQTEAPQTEEPKEKTLDSERFAALTKKERQIQKRARELQEKERALMRWEEAEKLAGTNKLEAIKRLGITYDDLTNLHLSQMGADEQTPEAIATRKAQEIARQELEAFKKQQEEVNQQLQQQQYQNAKLQIQSEAKALTAGRPEDFAYINLENAHDTIVELIEQTYFQDGRLMPVEEAAREIETYLENKYEKLSQLPKFRSKYMPAVAQDQKPSALKAENTQKPQTLTHRNTTSPVTPRYLSQEERKQRAIRIALGQPID